MKTYTLRPEYEGVLVGGTVVAGPNGESLEVLEALKEGDGKISTDSPVLQASLEAYYGEHGLVFDVNTVDPSTGEETPVERPESTQAPVPKTLSQDGVKAANTPAEHGDQSDYATFSPEELRDTLQERGISYPGRPSKENMISLLEEDDQKRVEEGASNGS